MLLSMSARSLWKSGMEGLSSASFCSDRQRLAVLGLRFRGLPVSDSKSSRGSDVVAARARNSVTAGLSSASFCWIASAWRYSASASDDLPVDATVAEDLWLSRQSLRNSVTAGFVDGQLLLDRQRRGIGLRLLICPCSPADGDPVDRGRQVPPATRPSPPGRRPAPPGPHAPGGRPRALRRCGPCVWSSQPRSTGSEPGRPAPRRPPRSSGPARPAGSRPCGTSPPPRRSVRYLPADWRRPSGCAPRRP